MITRQERALRNAVILLAVAALVLGGLLFWSLRAMAILKGGTVEGDSPDIATAGGQPVTERQWMDELRKKHGDEVLLGMLNHIVVGMEAKALGISVTDDEVDQQLQLNMSGYESEEQYYAQMQSELGLSREEVREETVYRLTLQRVATAGIMISEADIDNYLAQNAERFIPKKQLQLSIIEAENYEEAEQIMDRLEQGEDFAALARELSTDEESGKHGGKIGMLEEDDPFWPEELLNTAAGLNPGDIAGPLATEDGYAVIRLEQVITPAAPATVDIRKQVREELALEKAAPLQQVEKELREKYHTAIYIDNSLQD
ncbi:peptidylprolyl isomerase [Paenibacillus sp. PK3_47]|uniref:peptidylprolyl isomerase n=1 Tax=Paenibacillus sp. PK3_47 TaxID=2072642 RepID=UPI00201D7E7B|nr:peptidylprolyl isomerase [Paenibacillus sp. PK3_47]UQZ34256.1 peptidylprolyl isomerase [Paenibacillus sp. PK3_47]